LKQQNEVKALHELLSDRDNFVSIGLVIDPNEIMDDLKVYVQNNGYDWYYSVAPVEVAREISQLNGNQYLNPPPTPIFIIDKLGDVHKLPFGIKSAQSLYDTVMPFLNQ